MNEENAKDPRDLNGDGKVTFTEKVLYAADKANEKIYEVTDKVTEKAKELLVDAAKKIDADKKETE